MVTTDRGGWGGRAPAWYPQTAAAPVARQAPPASARRCRIPRRMGVVGGRRGVTPSVALWETDDVMGRGSPRMPADQALREGTWRGR